jgi:monoamine oxidase
MQSFSRSLASELKPGTVHLSSPVACVERRENGLCDVRTTTGTVHTCKRVVITVPTCLYDTITFVPPLPESKRCLYENTTLGYYSKMILVFQTPWWRQAGLSGVLSCDAGPISFSRDTSIPADDQWSISCFIVAERGRQWSKLSKAARRRQVWEQFCVNFESVVESIPSPINTIEQEWTKQPYFWGAPCPVMAPGVLTKHGSAMCTRADSIHFAGTETSIVWKGYMEGAVRSGQRCAAEVVKTLLLEKAQAAL